MHCLVESVGDHTTHTTYITHTTHTTELIPYHLNWLVGQIEIEIKIEKENLPYFNKKRKIKIEKRKTITKSGRSVKNQKEIRTSAAQYSKA